jgi:hypothetical protein
MQEMTLGAKLLLLVVATLVFGAWRGSPATP